MQSADRRQFDGHRRPDPDRRIDFERASMHIDEGLYNRKPQPGAARFVGIVVPQPAEGRQYEIHPLRGNAFADI